MATPQDIGHKATLPTLARDNAAGLGAFGLSALVRWENEGGSIPARPGRAPALAAGASATTAAAGDSHDVAAMQARLNADFANGLVGRRYNTYQHRARIVRHLRSRAAAASSEAPLRSEPSVR